MEKKLYRSRSDRMLFGVCGGIAEYLNTDPTLIRIITVVSALISEGMLLLYIILAIIIPENPAQKKINVKTGKSSTNYVLGLALICFGVLMLLKQYSLIDWRVTWPALLILIGPFLLWQEKGFQGQQEGVLGPAQPDMSW